MRVGNLATPSGQATSLVAGLFSHVSSFASEMNKSGSSAGGKSITTIVKHLEIANHR